MIDRKSAPPITEAVDFNLVLKPYEKFILDNGVPVYSVNAGAEEVMMVELVFFAGNCFEEKNMVASAANFLVKNGTKTKTAFQLNEHFEFYGSYLKRACFNETATITLLCLNKHIKELLPVVREMLTESVIPEEELSIFTQNMKQRLSVSMRKSDYVAGRLMDSYLYGKNHPYGKEVNPEDLDALNREELLAFYKNYYTSGNCMILVAGKLPPDTDSVLNKTFGDLPFGNNFTVPSYSVMPEGKKGEKIRVTNDPKGIQGSIRLARPFPNRHHPDFQKALIVNNALGGYFGSRLMKNIREEKGYTYGIHSYLQNHIQHSAWMISTEVGKDVCEAAIDEIYKELKILQTQLIGEEELRLVKNYMIGIILGDLDGPFHIISRWKNYLLNNMEEGHFEEAIRIIKSVTAEELMEIAQRYFGPEEFYELVVV